MSPEKVRQIAQLGGKSVSSDKDHMAKIGAIGGRASGKVRAKKTVQS